MDLLEQIGISGTKVIHPKRLVAAYIYIVWTKWQIFAYFEPQKKISLPLMQRKKVRGKKGALCIVVVYMVRPC